MLYFYQMVVKADSILHTVLHQTSRILGFIMVCFFAKHPFDNCDIYFSADPLSPWVSCGKSPMKYVNFVEDDNNPEKWVIFMHHAREYNAPISCWYLIDLWSRRLVLL